MTRGAPETRVGRILLSIYYTLYTIYICIYIYILYIYIYYTIASCFCGSSGPPSSSKLRAGHQEREAEDQGAEGAHARFELPELRHAPWLGEVGILRGKLRHGQ